MKVKIITAAELKNMKIKPTLADVHRMIDEKCVQACQQTWIEKPLAWALYQVWREVDEAEEEVARMMRGMYPEPEQQPIPPMPK